MGTKSIGVKLVHLGNQNSFLTFAVDTMVFAKASDESCHTIKIYFR